ncbi:MAG: 2-amino-4-hydroxy-6-hydroxymethyldihydropteridine diphosphokinase [Chloroflexota bacterium]
MSAVKPETVYLGLGSNLGKREENLSQALNFLSERLKIAKVSSIYETEPVGNPNQPPFLNMVCQAETAISPLGLLILVKAIENKLGRMPDEPDSPRTIDIDILFYGDRVMETPQLTVPHPRLRERAFVLVPLAELAPDLVHPVAHKTVSELLSQVGGKEGVRLFAKRK